MYGKPMSQGMRRVLWAFFALLAIGGITLVNCQWRQQKKAIEARTPKIDRSAKALNAIDPATPPKDPTFAKKKPASPSTKTP